jgi:hypothetical protein
LVLNHTSSPKEENYFKVASVVLDPKFSSMNLYLIDIPPDHRCHVNVQFMLSLWNLKKPQTAVALGLWSICDGTVWSQQHAKAAVRASLGRHRSDRCDGSVRPVAERFWQ